VYFFFCPNKQEFKKKGGGGKKKEESISTRIGSDRGWFYEWDLFWLSVVRCSEPSASLCSGLKPLNDLSVELL